MNIKQHTIQSGERILLVSVPEDAKDLQVPHNISTLMWDKGFIYLPKGNWQLIGLSDEITEEQAKELVLTRVDQSSFPTSMEYYNYLSDRMVHLSFDFDTAIESFKSLMQSLECYTENHYGNDPCEHNRNCYDSCQGSCWQRMEVDYEVWEEAQKKVARYAVLKEVIK